MQRFWEIIFGLDRGFLSREGEFSLQFNPVWPWQDTIGAGVWNFLLVALAVAVVIYVYRREGKSRPVRVLLGGIRLALLLFVVALLNRPVLTLGQSRTEPSVLAVMIDDSVSMRVRDGGAAGPDGAPVTRLEAVAALLTERDQALLNALRKEHVVRLYRFSRDAEPLLPATQPSQEQPDVIAPAIAELKPEGQHTQLLRSVRSVLDDLQGQRLAGVVVMTDGRETPQQPVAEALAAVKDYGAKIYPVAVGSDEAPKNIEIQSVTVQDTAFKGDVVVVRASVRGTGVAGQGVKVQLKDKKTGRVLPGPTGESTATATLADGEPVEVELPVKADEVGTLDLVIEAVKQPGELDDEDNTRTAQVAVLDAKINVLYVDGYPRWEYRYLKNEMIRDATIDIACLLTSADPTFAQEGDPPRPPTFRGPVRRFPESIEEMMEYDVVLFGDVDPRQFSDNQLQLVADFVAKRGGGFGMIAGPQSAPHLYRNTAIEPILPVNISRVEASEDGPAITTGFRPELTREGEASTIFRFFPDKQVNAKFLAEQIPPIFWYCRGPMVKPGVGEVLAQHPSDVGPDGRKAPILVTGRFGAGRTLFSAIDDSWRWRFYTGETVFDTYWVQQVRYLARSKKLGQRRMTLTTLRPTYELGQQVRVSLRLLDPQLMQQLPEQIRVEVLDAAGQVVRHETLIRQEGQPDLYVANWSAERVGRFTVRLPPIAGGVDAMDLPIEVSVPRLELAQPQVDRTFLTRVASETNGRALTLAEARGELPNLIPSAARVIPLETGEPLWDAPLALALFVLLITTEWVVRKMYGMV